MSNLENLLQKYFDGETSLKEEEQLKNAFLTHSIPTSMERYRYLFEGFEALRSETMPSNGFEKYMSSKLAHKHHTLVYHLIVWSSAAIVTLFLSFGTIYYLQRQNNYMIVNGQRINDPEKALMMAANKLHLVTGKFNNSLYQVEQMGKVGKHLSLVSLFQKHDTLSNDSITLHTTTTNQE
ncbi:MAG: hypothetical protein ACP5F6_06790 [Microbacter sp.]